MRLINALPRRIAAPDRALATHFRDNPHFFARELARNPPAQPKPNGAIRRAIAKTCIHRLPVASLSRFRCIFVGIRRELYVQGNLLSYEPLAQIELNKLL